MRCGLTASTLLLLGAVPLAAQDGPGLDRLAFMSGCWAGSFLRGGRPVAIEEHYTAPSANVMLGTTRYLAGGRTTEFEFSLIRADSAGIALVPFPNGVRSPHEFRLTRVTFDSAVFEAPEHDYPRRIRYRRAGDGTLVAAIDAGPGDPNPREWSMRPVACLTGQPQLAGEPRPAGPDRSGRVMLYFTQTINGLWLGIAVPAMAGADGASAYGLGLLLGGPGGLLFAKAVNDAGPVTLGQATAITWAGWWGAWNGIGVYAMQDLAEERELFRNTVLGLVGGTAVGMLIARQPIAAGDASLAAHASVWGTWYGAVVAVLVDANDAWPYILAGGNAALLGGIAATGSVDVSAGRVWITTAAGLAGLVAGLGIDLLIQPGDDNAAILIPAITNFAGLAAGIALTRNLERGRVGMAPSEAPSSFLAVRDGEVRFGLPLPEPALVPREDRDGRRRWAPGLRVTLLDLRH